MNTSIYRFFNLNDILMVNMLEEINFFHMVQLTWGVGDDVSIVKPPQYTNRFTQ